MFWGFNMKILCLVGILLVSSAWAFDPMAPPGFQKKSVPASTLKKAAKIAPKYILRQIVIRGDRKSAVINGYVLNEGDLIKGAKVMKIEANKVILEISKKQKTLQLKPNIARVRR